MATGKKEYTFKNCTISLEDNEIIEYDKDGNPSTHVLSDFLKEIESSEDRINFNIKIEKSLVPKETEGII